MLIRCHFTVFKQLRSQRFWRALHLWLSLLLSLQIIAWFGSGLLMAWLPIEQVRGNHLLNEAATADWQQVQLSPAQALSKLQAIVPAVSPAQLSLTQRGSQPVYQWQSGQHRYYLDANSGQLLAPLTAAEASDLALQRYRGDAKLPQAELLPQIPAEARGLTAPVWQLRFQDQENTVFYLHANTGQLLKVRTDRWRLFDFVWMLHIMDYQEREDFNHGLLIASSALALLFSLSGVVLLCFSRKRLRPGRA